MTAPGPADDGSHHDNDHDCDHEHGRDDSITVTTR
jgi:hypothetical protein